MFEINVAGHRQKTQSLEQARQVTAVETAGSGRSNEARKAAYESYATNGAGLKKQQERIRRQKRGKEMSPKTAKTVARM